MAEHDRGTGATHGLVDRAEELLDEHTRPEHPRKYADHDGDATWDDLREEQYRETTRQAPNLGPVGVVTEAQGHGFFYGALVGGLVGALVMWPFGFIEWGEVVLGWRIFSCALIGAIAGGAVGAVYFAGRLPELEGETTGAHNQPGSSTTLRDPGTDDRGRMRKDEDGSS